MSVPPLTALRDDGSDGRAPYGAAFKIAVRSENVDDKRKYSRLLSTRQVVAIVATAQGRVWAQRCRRHSYGFSDEWLQATAADYGIGPFTLSEMQRDDTHHAALIESPSKPGPIGLTEYGAAVLTALSCLKGFNVERAAA